MSSVSQKKNSFKVQIRRKGVEDKIAQLRARAAFLQEQGQSSHEYSDLQITQLVQQTLSSKEKLIQNIQSVKTASFHIGNKNSHLFFPLIQEFCYLLGNLEDIKLTQKYGVRDALYNDIVTVLINISSNEAYQWPPSQYLLIIKNLLRKQREINTMWLLSNILYQRQNQVTQQSLTRQLIKYDCLSFCSQRLEKKFENDKDIDVFACFVCTFLSNSQFLTLEELKIILKVLENLSTLNNQSIDWFILQSMNDHAPQLANMNYELLHSQILKNIKQRYIKKKKTKTVLKFLEFVKTYIFTEIQQSLNVNSRDFKDNKIAKNNYQRISVIILPCLTICLENISPEVKANLMEICSMLLDFYFPFVDLQHQSIYLTLAEGLAKNAVSVLSKYSNRALYWQLKLVGVLLEKIREYKISTEIVFSFISENEILEAFSILLKEKTSMIEIVQQIISVMLLLFSQIDKEELVKSQNGKNQYHLNSIKHTLELILDNHLVNDQETHDKIERVISLCENKN